jgi:hypothetical protein
MYYKNGRCTDRHGIKFNSFTDPIESIDCRAYIGAGFMCFERRKEVRKMDNGHNGGWLKTYKVPCLKGICDEICEVEELGYVNGVMHVRCLECGFEQHGEDLTPI